MITGLIYKCTISNYKRVKQKYVPVYFEFTGKIKGKEY